MPKANVLMVNPGGPARGVQPPSVEENGQNDIHLKGSFIAVTLSVRSFLRFGMLEFDSEVFLFGSYLFLYGWF